MSTANDLHFLTEACRANGWLLVISPHTESAHEVSVSLQGPVWTERLVPGATLEEALAALWAEVRAWARERATRDGQTLRGDSHDHPRAPGAHGRPAPGGAV